MFLLWIFAGVLAGMEGQDCPNITRYNGCGQNLQSNISSATNLYTLPLEAVNYICWNGRDTVTCFLEGLQACPNSSITFKSEFTQQQWNVSLIRALVDSGCQSPGAQAFDYNYECMSTAIKRANYSTCVNQTLAANPLGVNNSISCRLQKESIVCITTHIGGSCNNQTALDFFRKWYYIKGNIEPGCSAVNGAELLTMAGTFPLAGTIFIFVMLLL